MDNFDLKVDEALNEPLTNENYFSAANSLKYMGSSQFKAFLSCESGALAELNGEYPREETTALLVGSYVDAHFEGTLDIFRAKHPEIFKKDGGLKSEYLQADYIIQRVERDPVFMKYMAGEKQVIMVGEISGVPYKIKIDSYHEGKAIVDLKCMRDFSKQWDNGKYVNFIDFWRYDIQGAIYQEIVRQNTGKQLPFILAAATKEKETDLGLFEIPQDVLDMALAEVVEKSPIFNEIKQGKIPPNRCEICNSCRFTKKLTGFTDYRLMEV